MICDESRSMRSKRNSVFALLMGFAATPAFANVTVTQNTGPGATSWTDTPLIQTVSNPSSQLVVGETFAAATSIAETFTVPGPSNYSLQTIELYVGGGSGTSASATATLSLYDLGGRIAPNPSSYAPAFNLLGGGKGLPI